MKKRYRVLKIYARCRYRRYDVIEIPEIRLQGEWLREAGFNEGEEIIVEKEQGVMIIRLKNNLY